MSLTKANLTDSIHTRIDLPKAKSTRVVESLLEIIEKTLANGEDVLITGFGKFCAGRFDITIRYLVGSNDEFRLLYVTK